MLVMVVILIAVRWIHLSTPLIRMFLLVLLLPSIRRHTRFDCDWSSDVCSSDLDLPNRVLLTDRLTQAISLARRTSEQLAVLFLDLDHFKNINDSLGHAIGDKLLQSVAQRLVACARHSDTVSRQGGDEFVVLLPQIGHAADATVLAQKMMTALAAPHTKIGRASCRERV